MNGLSFSTELGTVDAITRRLDRWLPVSTDEETGLVRPMPFEMAKLYPKQGAIINDPARFTITEATTKAGKTMSHLEWLIHSGCQKGYGDWWWIATVYKTAMMAFTRTKRRLDGYLMHKGQYIKVSDPIPYVARSSKRTITVGGATFWFLSADRPDNLYGEDVLGAVGDEVTRWKEEAWTALYSTLTATQGRAKLIGNVKGRNNWAYKLARRAEAQQTPTWSHHKLTAWDAVKGGVVERATILEAKADLDETVFKMLYLAEPAEDGGNPFGIKWIEASEMSAMAKGPVVAFGADLAKSTDYAWVIGLNESGQVVISERFPHGLSWKEITKKIHAIVGNKPVRVDSTGVGDAVFEMIAAKCRRAEPFVFSGGVHGSKQRLMEGLAWDFQNGGIGIFDSRLISELKSMEYEHTRNGVIYTVPAGQHDDGVDALGLAALCLRENPGTSGRIRSFNN